MEVNKTSWEQGTNFEGIDPQASTSTKQNELDYASYKTGWRQYDSKQGVAWGSKVTLRLERGSIDHLKEVAIKFTLGPVIYGTPALTEAPIHAGYKGTPNFINSLEIRRGNSPYIYNKETLFWDIWQNAGFWDSAQKEIATNLTNRWGTYSSGGIISPGIATAAVNGTLYAQTVPSFQRNALTAFEDRDVFYLPLPFFARRFSPVAQQCHDSDLFLNIQLENSLNVVEQSRAAALAIPNIIEIALVAKVHTWGPQQISRDISRLNSGQGLKSPIELINQFTPVQETIKGDQSNFEIVLQADSGMYSEIIFYMRPSACLLQTTAITKNCMCFRDMHTLKGPDGAEPMLTITSLGQSTMQTQSPVPLTELLWSEDTSAQSKMRDTVIGMNFDIEGLTAAPHVALNTVNKGYYITNKCLYPIYRWSAAEWEQISHDSGEQSGAMYLGPTTKLVFSNINTSAGAGVTYVPVILGFKRGTIYHKTASMFIDWDAPKHFNY